MEAFSELSFFQMIVSCWHKTSHDDYGFQFHVFREFLNMELNRSLCPYLLLVPFLGSFPSVVLFCVFIFSSFCVLVFALSYRILFYYYLLEANLFSNEAQQGDGSRCEGICLYLQEGRKGNKLGIYYLRKNIYFQWKEKIFCSAIARYFR